MDQLPGVGPVSRPFDQTDIDKIREMSLPQETFLEVPVEETAIRACSLSEVLAGRQAPMRGVGIEPLGRGKQGPADQGDVWFDGAALGDDVGLVSTQTGALKRLTANGASADATDIVLYRVTPAGLTSIEVSDTEKELFVREAAAVQPHDLDMEIGPADDHRMQAIEQARSSMNDWYRRMLGVPVAMSFDKLGPLIAAAAARQLEAAPGEKTNAARALDLCRSDPALSALLIAQKDDVAALARAADRPPPAHESLLRRFARANNVLGVVAVHGVLPEAETNALTILKDVEVRRKLSDARIALDNSTSDLRSSIEEALGALHDRDALTAFARSLQGVRSRAADADLIFSYLNRSGGTDLQEAVELARGVTAWRADRAQIDQRIDAIGTPVSAPQTGDKQRRLEDIRENIRKTSSEHAAVWGVERIAEFDLEELDEAQVLRLENALLTLVHGPERERLINDLLEKLEMWARLKSGFFIQLAESEFSEKAQHSVRPMRRDGAMLFINRVEYMLPWQLPATPADGLFSQQRLALQKKLEERWQPEIPAVDASGGDFQRIVAPVADHLLHHRAFRALREVSAAARARDLGDKKPSESERKLARGLVAWPRGAEVTWEAGMELAKALGPSQSQQLIDTLAPPNLA